MTWSLSGFRLRLAVLIGGLSLLWVAGAAYYFDHVATAHMNDASVKVLASVGQAVSRGLSSNLEERQRSIEMLSGLPALTRGDLDSDEVRSVLTRTKSGYRYYAWIGVADRDGVVKAATGGLLEGESVVSRPWFIHGRQEPFTGDIHEAVLLARLLGPSESGEPLRLVDFAVPVFDAHGQLRGVVAAHADWTWARSVIESAVPAQASANGVEVLIVNKDGLVLYPVARDAARELVPAALLAGDVQANLDWPGKGPCLSSSHAIKAAVPANLGWRVVVRQSQDAALASVRDMHQGLALLAGVGILLLTGTAFLFASRFSRPIERLAHAAGQLAQGQEHVRLRSGSTVAELQTLDAALREMMARLMGQRQALQEANAHLEQRVAQRTAELSDLYNHAPVGYHTVSAEGMITQINDTELALLGYARDEVVGKMPVEAFIAPACKPIAAMRLEAIRRGQVLPPQDADLLAKDGRLVSVRLTSMPVFDEQGRFIASRTAVMNISDMKALASRLDKQQAINQAIVRNSPNGLLLYTADGQCVLANESVAEMVGADVETLLKQNFMQIESWRLSGLRDAALAALDGVRTQRQISSVSTFGKQVECLVTLMPLDAGGERMVLAVVRDVSELVRANKELARLARQDGLTGLANRLAADEQLHQELSRSRRSGAHFSVLLLDVDHFKRVNDTHGHDVGDQVLKSVAWRLKDAVRASDFVARFGGEEFLIILPDTAMAEAVAVAEKIRATMEAAPFQVVGQVTVSVGVSQASAASARVEDVVRLADQALYASKHAGRNCVTPWGVSFGDEADAVRH